MNLNSSPKIINLLTLFNKEYISIIEKDLYNKYSKDQEKLNILIIHLENNNINLEDINIQIILNYFLEFVGTQIEVYTFTKNDEELISLKFVKLTLSILHKIKNNELSDHFSKIEEIQQKKEITVKEFEVIYNISKSSQATYRGRLYDPLPFHQVVQNGNITYNVKEVELWKEQQHK